MEQEKSMPFAAALSKASRTARAVEEACAQVREKLSGIPDLACVFFSPHHLESTAEISNRVQVLGARTLIGCVGEGIICNEREVEQEPAMCVWAGTWPKGLQITPFHIDLEQTPDGFSLLGWPDELLEAQPERSALLVLGEPRTFPSDVFLEQINDEYPGLRVLGGMASGAWNPDECRLLLNDRIVHSGAVGVLLQGDFQLRSVVSQGCRPIGKHMIITRGHDNVIEELSGKPAFAQLQQLFGELPPHDRELVQQGLHVGLVMNEYQGEFQRGDFLVRNVIGLDRKSGAIGITDKIRVGQTIQFHVRDAQTADEDLHHLLKLDASTHTQRPGAALLFSCNGRGTRLFSAADHDASAVRGEIGEIPVAGFFAAGELGPISGRNFIHGFTASVALFEG
jgi:small ligand-binding sensory domain FIST